MKAATHMYRGLPGADSLSSGSQARLAAPKVYAMSLTPTSVGGQVAGPRTIKPQAHLIGLKSVDFAWGYNGNGPLHLALALLVDALGDERKAVALAHIYLNHVIARIPADEPWIVSDNMVRAMASAIAGEAVPA